MKRIGSIFLCIVPALLAFVIQISTTIFIMIGYGIIMIIHLIAQGKMDFSLLYSQLMEFSTKINNLMIISIIYALICTIVFGLWYKHEFGGDIQFNIKKISIIKKIPYLFMLGYGLQVIIGVILNYISGMNPNWFDSYNKIITELGNGNPIIAVIYIGFLGPINEEFIFRGIVFEKSKKHMSVLGANILQATLFGIYHGNLVQGIYAFCVGLILGFINIKLNTIFAPILLHIFFNLSGFIVDALSAEPLLQTRYVITAIILLAIVAIVYSTVKLFDKKGFKNFGIVKK